MHPLARANVLSESSRDSLTNALFRARGFTTTTLQKIYNVNITNDTQPPVVVVLRVGKNMKLFFTPCRYTPHSLPTTTTSLREQSSRRRRAGRQARQHTHTLTPLGTTNEAQTGKSATLPPYTKNTAHFDWLAWRAAFRERTQTYVDGAALPDWLDSRIAQKIDNKPRMNINFKGFL